MKCIISVIFHEQVWDFEPSVSRQIKTGTMEEVESMPISVDASSHDSVDSGYLSILTPHTSGCTSMVTGYRTRSSSGALLSAKKHCRFRTDPFQCEKAQRRRSKLNHTLNASESDYLVSESSSVEQESVLEPSCTNVNQSLSLVHSTPSCADKKYTEILRIKNRRNWRTTVLITPASNDFQLLSPPLSPAVPSSSFVASEPVEEDVEMKLVHSTEGKSQVQATPPRLKVSIPRIVISPARRRISPAITSENQKLSKLCIADLAVVSEIKPKRLDFSHRGLCVALRNNIRRATLDHTGREKVDFLSLLGEESNHLNLVSKILSYLGPPDLCSVSMVSTAWRRICENDFCANGRRMSYILRKQNIKENLKVTLKKAKREEDIQTSPKSRHYARKGFLVDVQNLLYVPAQPRPPNSPPVSPSKVKFHSFVKVSRSIYISQFL